MGHTGSTGLSSSSSSISNQLRIQSGPVTLHSLHSPAEPTNPVTQAVTSLQNGNSLARNYENNFVISVVLTTFLNKIFGKVIFLIYVATTSAKTWTFHFPFKGCIYTGTKKSDLSLTSDTDRNLLHMCKHKNLHEIRFF